MAVVYIISKEGKPLMPTTRNSHVRWLLKTKQARVVGLTPFTIQLKYKTENKTQELIMGIDSGRTNIGISVIKSNGEEVFSAEVESRNKDITKLMTERKEHRMASRRGRRLRRQRRAVKNNTAFTEKERYLPSYEKPITLKLIKNKEARFCNRTRPEGWLTPTVRHCVQTHVNLVKKVSRFLPITAISIEVNSFDFQLMNNPHIQKWQYNKGTLFGYKDINDYVSESQNGKCLLCRGEIAHYHHIVPRSSGGSNSAENIAGLCFNCHSLVHKNEKVKNRLSEIKEGINKKYAGSSVLNAAMPYIIEALSSYNLWLTTGKRTKAFRDKNGITKSHSHDAYCIASDMLESSVISILDSCFKIKQYRRHDRAVIHKANFDKKYYLDNKLVAVNRHKSMCQTANSLAEYKEELSQHFDLSDVVKIISQLICKPHKPAIKDINRTLPGALIRCNNDIFVLKGTDGKHNNIPDYYVSENKKKYRYKTCSVVHHNAGLVIMQ